MRAIEKIRARKEGAPMCVDEGECLRVAEKFREAYRDDVARVARVVNEVAAFVPSRRKRKLHVGLFGYSRSTSRIALPRAVPFTAALYSIGFPPGFLGLRA